MLILHKPNSRAKCYTPATPGAAFRGTPAPDCLLPSEANGWGVSEIIAQYVLATFRRCQVRGNERYDGSWTSCQKAEDGSWVSSVNLRQATNRAASCLR